jgi:hypothetical protein
MVMGKCVSVNFQFKGDSVKIVSSQVMPGINETTSASGVAEFSKLRGKSSEVAGSWQYKITLGLCRFLNIHFLFIID